MPGFLGCYGNSELNLPFDYKANLIIKSLSETNLFVQTRTIKKFERDKIFHNDMNYFILTEGVIFNIKELQREYHVDSLVSLCIEMYNKDSETFFNKFRGSFSGVFYDKKEDILLVYTDHIGDKPVFYSSLPENNYIFGSEISYFIELFNANKISYSLDLAGAYSLLSYSFMLADLTYVEGIRRITAGYYLKISNNKLSIKKYHSFNYKPDYSLSDNDIVEKIDKLFIKAVSSQLRKNEEYGYKNIAALSAGLDTRITNFAINRIIKKPIMNFTYSPIGFPDEVISKQIAKKLKNSHLYQANDNSEALLLIDEGVEANEGLMTYYGSSIIVDFFKIINLEKYGIIHTGQIGDVIVGSYTKKIKNLTNITENKDAYSTKLIYKFNEFFDFEKYKKQFTYSEEFSLYNKAFTGVNSGSLLVFQQQTESFSPFMDVDFFEFCLSIPLEKRLKFHIYDKWILSKYPDAAKYSHNGLRHIGKKPLDTLIIKYYLKKMFKIIEKKLGIKSKISITSVTPLNYWYYTNNTVKKTLDAYFFDNISRLKHHPELQSDCEKLYTTGTSMEKNQVLTLLAILKKFFVENYSI